MPTGSVWSAFSRTSTPQAAPDTGAANFIPDSIDVQKGAQ